VTALEAASQGTLIRTDRMLTGMDMASARQIRVAYGSFYGPATMSAEYSVDMLGWQAASGESR
jgi:hypothetical protein